MASAETFEGSSTHELVQLVDEDGTPLGTAPKATVHTTDTPLHLAFSCHVYSPDGRVLVTRRALGKKTWPGVWSNAFCGHPAPGEAFEEAIRRRAQRELGLDVESIEPVLPDFRYRAVDASGIVEHEVCPVYRAVAASDPAPADDEVAEWAWTDPDDFRAAVAAAPYAFSPWLVLQLDALAAQGR
ncbi:isopentenyl-diphosphate Delta-isomerase [Sinomonas sp. R1AF57]|uniref:isopentenyl-diphosphate Delta-isomerase n=1 Tax=Sinomonas sp. R1AF57 TaxID=2020377 RepID=UPI000B5DC926|nr:isopentenyl-diphosphate Delta-isomerase [Sinomonas sp. R1AF57]ASN50679.1 isopentenyl-diphosphate delta-isomerase [Sinomonas sp. R1AF57]